MLDKNKKLISIYTDDMGETNEYIFVVSKDFNIKTESKKYKEDYEKNKSKLGYWKSFDRWLIDNKIGVYIDDVIKIEEYSQYEDF